MPRKTDVLEQKSPAEFFAENKNIAGFDNVSSVSLWTGFVEPAEFRLKTGCLAAREEPVHYCERACGKFLGCC